MKDSYVYSFFCICEYVIVYAIIKFHGTAKYDFVLRNNCLQPKKHEPFKITIVHNIHYSYDPQDQYSTEEKQVHFWARTLYLGVFLPRLNNCFGFCTLFLNHCCRIVSCGQFSFRFCKCTVWSSSLENLSMILRACVYIIPFLQCSG